MNTNRTRATAALAAAGVAWGASVPLSKVALDWLAPGWLTVARFGVAAIVLLLAVPRPALRAAFTPGVVVAGALGYGGSVLLQNAGLERTSVTHAALLIGAVPVLVAIIAALWQHAVARPVAWAGFALSLAGVGAITGGHAGGTSRAGDALVLASALLSATVTVAQGRLLPGRDPVAVTAAQFVGAALFALPLTVATEPLPAVPAGAGAVLALAGITACGTLLPFTLFAYGQRRVSAEMAGAFLNLEPLVGAAAGIIAFGDPAGPRQLAGGAAVVAGIGLSSLPLLRAHRGGGHRLELESVPALSRPRPSRRPPGGYSVHRTAAGRRRAARQPGHMAMRTATSKVAGIVARMSPAGMSGDGAMPAAAANPAHACRPASTPSGRPASSATQPNAPACHTTRRSTWPRLSPSVLSTARSLRRRRTPVASTCARVPTARTTNSAPRTSDVSRTPA
jgi:drug/metabolite transporter (DMT)-like permease